MNDASANSPVPTVEDDPATRTAPTTILVLTVDDSRMHMYPSIDALLADKAGLGGERHPPVEFFDVDGHHLAPGFGSGWELLSLDRTAEPPNPDLVVNRLSTVMRNAVEMVMANPAAVRRAGLTVEDALARIPDLYGMSLRQALQTCYRNFDHPPSNDGDAWHNLVVHGIW